MTKLFLFCTFLFCFFIGKSAEYYRKIHWTQPLQTSNIEYSSIPDFENSIIVDQTKLPYWFESFEIKSATSDFSVIDAVYEPVPFFAAGLTVIPEGELQIKSELSISAERSFLRLTICPFIRKNNQILKLVDFTLSIRENDATLKSAVSAYQWNSTSVLGTGQWIQIKTKSKGIFKITFDQLKTWGFSNPDQVAMYGNGGYMLPYKNKDIQFDDLKPYPVWKGKDSAGKDCLFFYSTGNISMSLDVATGQISHQQNVFSTETYFYLTDQGSINTINKREEVTASAGKTILSFPNYAFYEKEALNLISSGSQWFGERFITGSTQTINMALDHADNTKPARFKILVAGKSSASSTMSVALNAKAVKNIIFQEIDVSDPTTYYADDKIAEFTENIPSSNLQYKLTYNASNSSSEAWLDYISVNYESLLFISSDVYFFRGKGNDGLVQVSEFILSNATATTKILDITDINNVLEVPAIFSNNQLKFKSNSTTLREYVAFNPVGTISVPDLVGTVVNQNLHTTDVSEMIIVSNPALLGAANDLANFHRVNDQMTIQVLTPEMIYNEFSGGLPDPSALRNYFRMCYENGIKNGKNTLKYILLMGDGSYDNRNILGKNHNLIPTFQSENSLSPTESFVTDDFYVFLGENEGGAVGTVDLGIGRIPARTADEAELVAYKAMNYNQQETMGNWRNVVTFIGDDEDNNTHVIQAESMANSVNSSYPAFFTDKIYLDAYSQISTPSGEKYPDVTTAINNRVKQGTLVMNYTGHANEKNLAAENVLDIGNINSWTNSGRLPIFVTATCEFSRFDADETSAGEQILLNPTGGGVGLFSTTRLVYSGANFVLNSKFFKYIFEKDEQGKNLRLGEVMRLAKATANTGTNQLNFTLLADPALRLANPNNQVITTSIDGSDVQTTIDTIRTLSVVTVKGFVADSNGAKLSAFNGEIIPTVFDKAMQVETLGNAGQEPFNYKVQNNVIYKGLASVKNGEFEFSFFVPKDISYKLGKGKILYYAYNESIDAQGYFDGFYIGGSANTTISDSNGPQIDLFMNTESFKDGGIVSASSVLLANITDDTGINTAGTGIGHDITAILDGDYSNIMVLNDYFQANKDNYKTGKIIFPLTKLSEGEHTLVLKVWDVLNNSAEKEIRFVVKDVFRIETVVNYPNPMQDETSFLFTSNLPDETFLVDLEVFQTNGSRIDQMKANVGSQGTESIPLKWIPSERNVRMMPGVYVYKLSVTAKDGRMSSGSGRLVFVSR